MRYSDGGMGALLAVALAVFVGAHFSLVAGLNGKRSWKAALAALVVPPLAPWWGWRDGIRRRATVWLAALGVYALGTILGQVFSGR
ncbi:MAG: hypothetical protein ACLP1X_10300 [Polyangiaceae bacterium]